MSGPNRSLDCPVESGEPRVVPDHRRWDWNVPSLVAIMGLMGSLVGYAIMTNQRQTKTEGDIELLKLTDKGIVDHTRSVEEVAVRDRAEMRDDIKEIKQLLLRDRKR